MSGTEEARTVQGEIIPPSADIPAENVYLVVQVEDVSRADAPSVVSASNARPVSPCAVVRRSHSLLKFRKSSLMNVTANVTAIRCGPISVCLVQAKSS
jgi:hypothetical protein